MSKADDSGSSHTPSATAESSVAYQYVSVQQMTTCRDQIEYQLTVREQPKQSRMCGVGEKADRRPIDPAPIVQLRVITHDRPISQSDPLEGAAVAPPVDRRPGHGATTPKTPGVRRGLPVTTALGDGWEDKAWYLENPYYFMYAMLCNADTDEELHLLSDGKTRYTSGSCVSCLYHLKDIDGSHQGFFVFPDLSIRVEGRYRLKLCLFETIGHSVHHCKSIYSDPFHVYTAKRFPGMEESTRLSKSFAEQGLKVRVRKHPRSRRRGSKRTKDDSDGSDDTPLARQSSPKRARASDIGPTSGLPIPQPLAPSRMPRSTDARFERADYDRKPLAASAYQDVKAAHLGRYATWEEEETMRMREARGWDPRYAHREEAMQERRLPLHDFVDGRYTDGDYAPRTRSAAAPPLAGMSARGASDYIEHGRLAYTNDDAARPIHDPPRRLSATSLSSAPPLPASSSAAPHPSMLGRGYPEPPASVAAANSGAPHNRNYPPAPAPMPLRPAPTLSRSYDHGAHPARLYDDYSPPPSTVDPRYNTYDPRDDPRYSAYDSRDRPPMRRLTPPSPRLLAVSNSEYSSRSPYPPRHSPSQWRSGPTSPFTASDLPLRRGHDPDPYARDEVPPSSRYVDGLGIAPAHRERLTLPPLSAAHPAHNSERYLLPSEWSRREFDPMVYARPSSRGHARPY
ncbi:hypothetical protein PHSY_004939 [Pseudozyma hubeiensis SY62]|uniref:Velvet domain-containing protein n=1 Tax=Pseudozyma hubeiensis (strain SY62) TaxID=1305764 RepID=R9P7Q9_PSEHS|nr:hypothetical protein PHSY_004939 [Pseudozyma hubeiensis SY62]GAC97354.1 hypothetical protein PHSY_004939 [Pseudozyma hubeiensis SY62]